MNAGPAPGGQRDGVMDRIDAHQGNITDAVADAGIANLGPEPLVAGGIGITPVRALLEELRDDSFRGVDIAFFSANLLKIREGGWVPLVFAALIFLTRVPVLSYGVRAYVDVPFLAVVVSAAVLEAGRPRRGAPVLVLLSLAGLLRPSSGRVQYDGRDITALLRTLGFEVLEGMVEPKSVVVIEFESMEQARRWYASPEYAKTIPMRRSAANASLVLVEGVPRK